MEIMQLQPVRANLIYPNRNKVDNPYIQTGSHVQIVEPMEDHYRYYSNKACGS